METVKLRATMVTLEGSGLSNVMQTVPVGTVEPSMDLWKRSTFVALEGGGS